MAGCSTAPDTESSFVMPDLIGKFSVEAEPQLRDLGWTGTLIYAEGVRTARPTGIGWCLEIPQRESPSQQWPDNSLVRRLTVKCKPNAVAARFRKLRRPVS
jgi:hypothetical protein